MNTPLRKKTLSLAVAAASFGLVSHIAVAQEGAATESATTAQSDAPQLEEVIVTSERREANLQETPIAITAFGSETIENFGITDLSDLEGIAPSLSITPFPNSKSSLVLFIRGVGNNDVQTSQDAAVGVYMDGVYLGRATGLTTDVADLERIEILRGPQGTLYGRNTTGGAVNFITAKPSEAMGVSVQHTRGSQDRWNNRLVVESGEIADQFRTKLSLMAGGKEGRVENLGPGEQTFGSETKQAGRLALAWDISEDVVADYSHDWSSLEGPQEFYQILRLGDGADAAFVNNFAASGFDAVSSQFWSNTFQASIGAAASEDPLEEGFWSRPVENSETDVSGHGLTVSWAINDDMTFKSITGFRDLEETVIQDYSGGPSPVFLVDVDIEQEQFSQEFQLIGDLGDEANYVVGAYFFTEESTEIEFDQAGLWVPDGTTFPVGPDTIQGGMPFGPVPLEYRTIDSENMSIAAYGQLTVSVSDKLDVTGGLRYTLDDRSAVKSSINFTSAGLPQVPTPVGPAGVLSSDQVFTDLSPSLTLDYQVNENINTYGKIVSAYKSGGFNVRSTEAGFVEPFDEEDMVSIEAGIKTTMADNRVRLNAAIYSSKYDDMQIQQISDPTTIFLTDVYNAGEATINGLEIDVSALLMEGLTLDFNYAYIDAEFDEVFDVAQGIDRTSDYEIPYAPEAAYNITLNYFTSLGFADLVAMVNYNWRDDQYGTADVGGNDGEGFLLEAYGLVNARLALVDWNVFGESYGALDIGLWGKNLTDEEYLVHSISQGTTHNGYFGEELSYGIDLKYHFSK